jgi:hypothetical protein
MSTALGSLLHNLTQLQRDFHRHPMDFRVDPTGAGVVFGQLVFGLGYNPGYDIIDGHW